VPYARPPTGALRWLPPQAPASWQGVRDAKASAPACWQATHSSEFVWRRGDFPRSEDCLYLNVWSPDVRADLPVMVWFHGGAHTSGMAHEKIFDGANLAREGVVLVTVNYRVGPLGFLAHPWLAEESDHGSAGNYGLLDKIAALNWVRDNISAFGGDATQITVFGQSAGSQSVCALMASPLAEGLFHRAIGQSGACFAPIPSDADGRVRGRQLVDHLSVDALQALREVDPERLLQAAEATNWALQSRIVIDGWVLPDPPRVRYQRGKHHAMPLLLGSLANEGERLLPLDTTLTEAELDAFLDTLSSSMAEPLKTAYAKNQASPGRVQRDILIDRFMTLAMRRWAGFNQQAAAPTFLYFMDHVPPAFHLYMPDDPQLNLPGGLRSAGAYHSGDLALVFGNTDEVGIHWNAEDRAVSSLMVRYWTNFAKQGDPNGTGVPTWPAYEAVEHTTLRLNPTPGPIPGAHREKLDLLERVDR